ncbi:Endoglucanase precursor [compost metagenome]
MEIVKNGVTLSLPADVLEGAINNYPAADIDKITVRLEVMNDSDSESVLDRISADKASVQGKGYVVRLDVAILNKAGMKFRYEKFNTPVQLAFNIPEGMDSRLLGVYYISSSGKLEFVGGHMANHKLQAELYHFSEYAVLEWSKLYTDVSANHWANMAIRTLSAKHVVTGLSDAEFAPSAAVTRAQFVTMIVRAFGLQGHTGKAKPFTDVADHAWYSEAISIASAAGIVDGASADRFEPNAEITREQMAAMVVRAWEAANGAFSTSSKELNFQDQTEVSDWALSAMQIAVEQNWLQGQGANLLAPKAFTTRAESAMLLYNVFLNQYQ